MMKTPLIALMLLVTQAAGQVSGRDYFAVQTHIGQLERTDIDSLRMEKLLDAVQAAGFTMIRDECWWSEVEKVRGEFSFPRSVDRLVRAAHRRGINMLMILNYNNPLYAPEAGSGIETESNRSAYVRYCQEVVKRYSRCGVKCFEIWNEPNTRRFWRPRSNATDYAKLVKAVYPSIKQIDPTAKVIVGCTSPSENISALPGHSVWLPYFEELFKNGIAEYSDAVSFHLYRVDRAPESYLFADIERLQKIVGKDRELWLTEVGYPTSAIWPVITLEDQANVVTRLYLLGRSIRMLANVFYYDLQDDGTNPGDNESNFGLLRNDGSPKPSYLALRAEAAFVGNRDFQSASRKDGIYSVSFGAPEEHVVAVWTIGKPRKTRINTGVLKNVIFDRDGGRIREALGDSLVSLEVTQRPKYIVSSTSSILKNVR